MSFMSPNVTAIAYLIAGVLFIMAVTSLSTLSVLTAAWSSANRIAILSAFRSVASTCWRYWMKRPG